MLKWPRHIRNKSLIVSTCLFGIFVTILCPFSKQAQAQQDIAQAHSPFVVISVDGLSFHDIRPTTMPNLYHISQSAAVGLVSINTGDGRSDIPAYLSTGAGTKLAGSKLSGWNGSASETTLTPIEPYPVTMGQLYQRWTGEDPKKSIVVPDIAEIQNHANTARWGSHVGFLGDQLHQNGLRTAAIGNADLADQRVRLAPLFVMDHKGTVDVGDVSEQTLVKDPFRPYGVKISGQKMFQATADALAGSNLIMIQWGDLNRLDSVYPFLQSHNYQTLRYQELKDADDFIGRIEPLIRQKQGNLLVTAITPLRDPVTGGDRYVSPLLITGVNTAPHTLLTSTTTHCQGLISNFDIAPSIINWMTVKTNQKGALLGHQIKNGRSINPNMSIVFHDLQQLEDDLTVLYQIRSNVLSIFVHLAECLLAVLLILLIWKREWLPYCKWMLELLATAPLAILLTPALHPHSANSYISELLLLQFVLLVSLQFLGNQRRKCMWLCIATSACIIFDVGFQQSTWMKQSILGYDLITGARYYGIGNEYMGVLLGCTFTSVLLLSGEPKHQPNYMPNQFLVHSFRSNVSGMPTLVLAITIIFLLASPRFGANAGGAIAAMVGFLMLWIKRRNVPFWRGISLSFAVVGGFGTLVLLALNVFTKDATTHITEAGNMLLRGETTKIWDIMVRKFSMNVHLLQVSMWGTLLWVTIATMLGWWWFSRRTIGVKTSQVLQAILGCVIAAFVCNDSGVLSAAAILLYVCIGVFAKEMDTIRTRRQQEFEWIDQQV